MLLLAGDVRDAWREALAPEFEVVTAGWLDGITAARLEIPDAVLVSADLPPQAPRLVLTAFRSDARLAHVPIVMATGDGVPPEPLWGNPRFIGDRYVAETIAPASLVSEIGEAVRAGRATFRRARGRQVALALLVTGAIALFAVRFVEEGAVGAPRHAGRVVAALSAVAIAALGASAAVVIATLRRRPTLAELRSVLGWAGFVLLQVQSLSPRGCRALVTVVAGSLGLLAWAAWAWLAPRAKPRTPAARRGWSFLAAILVLLAASPWLYVWIASGR